MKKELWNAFGNVFLVIEHDAQNEWVYNNWVGYQTPESVMHGANVCLEILQQQKCSKLLNDNQQVVGPWDHSTEWIVNDWTPRAIKAGLTHFANVVSPETMARTSAVNMNGRIGEFFTMQIFSDIAEAKSWLQQV